MSKWMDGWGWDKQILDGWMDGGLEKNWMHGWMDGGWDKWMHGWITGWMG